MAKVYARINWQNAPSTATPRNAENLNKMDKGIDDLDNKVETINNNLPHLFSMGDYTQGAYGCIYFPATINIETITRTNTYYIGSGTDSLGNTYNGYLYVSSPSTTETLHLFIAGTGAVMKFRTKWGGVWGAWHTITMS